MRPLLPLLAASLLSALPAGAQVLDFRDGLNGYTGTRDTQIKSNETASPGDQRNTNFGTEVSMSVDGDDGSPGARPNHGLVRFEGIIGGGANQIPAGSTITSAVLTLNVIDPGSGMNVHRLLTDWQELTATWNNLGSANNGVQLGVDAVSAAETFVGANNSTANVPIGTLNLTVTGIVQSWVDGATNYGFALIPFVAGTNGIDFDTREAATAENRPTLTVNYVIPEPTTYAALAAALALGLAVVRRRR